MTHPSPPSPDGTARLAPFVVEGEALAVAEALPLPLQYPRAVRPVCACGKDGSGDAHGAIGGRRPRADAPSSTDEFRRPARSTRTYPSHYRPGDPP